MTITLYQITCGLGSNGRPIVISEEDTREEAIFNAEDHLTDHNEYGHAYDVSVELRGYNEYGDQVLCEDLELTAGGSCPEYDRLSHYQMGVQ